MATRSILEFILNYDFTQNILSEATKWKRVAAAGGLSLASHKRLVKARVKKSVPGYLAGVDRGTENILKKTRDLGRKEIYDPNTGEKVIQSPRIATKHKWKNDRFKEFTPLDSGSLTNPNNDNTTQFLSAKYKDSDQAISRHEANEAYERARMKKKYGDQTFDKYSDQGVRFYNKNNEVGRHESPHVLRKEGELNRSLLSLYPQLKNNKYINQESDRQKSGEVSYYDKSSKDINKEINTVMNVVKDPEKNKKDFKEKHLDKYNKIDKYNKVSNKLNNTGLKIRRAITGDDEVEDTRKRELSDKFTKASNVVFHKKDKIRNELEDIKSKEYPTKYYVD